MTSNTIKPDPGFYLHSGEYLEIAKDKDNNILITLSPKFIKRFNETEKQIEDLMRTVNRIDNALEREDDY